VAAIAAVPAAAPAVAAQGPSGASFGEVLRRRALAGPAPSELAPAALRDLLGNVEHARRQLDRAVAEARSGRLFSAQELIALQVDAYRLNQVVEVASKVAESAAQAVKQAVNTQV
jgi:hypothetical protein